MKRLVQPEILDSLPHDHPDAAANRRDLFLVNWVMGNFHWIGSTLKPLLANDDRILEIGAGDGRLGHYLTATGIGAEHGGCGLDRCPRPSRWPGYWDWFQDDILTFTDYDSFTVLLANLILHQFDDETLRSLGRRISQSRIRLVIANEPARRRIHQTQFQFLRLFGLHPISRHDGHVSIHAGFLGNELPDRLELLGTDWQVSVGTTFLGGYRMIARRRADTSVDARGRAKSVQMLP